jgi:hypothetical protein
MKRFDALWNALSWRDVNLQMGIIGFAGIKPQKTHRAYKPSLEACQAASARLVMPSLR